MRDCPSYFRGAKYDVFAFFLSKNVPMSIIVIIIIIIFSFLFFTYFPFVYFVYDVMIIIIVLRYLLTSQGRPQDFLQGGSATYSSNFLVTVHAY